VLGKKWGYAVFAADALKGAMAVFSAYALAGVWKGPLPVHVAVMAAFFAIIGHSFPVWLGFKGGKGIATSAGIMLTLFPGAVSPSGLFVWLLLFFTTRFVSVASLGSAVTLPSAALALHFFGSPDSWLFGICDPVLVLISALMSALAIWRHKDNIKRLLAGTEKRFEAENPAPEISCSKKSASSRGRLGTASEFFLPSTAGRSCSWAQSAGRRGACLQSHEYRLPPRGSAAPQRVCDR